MTSRIKNINDRTQHRLTNPILDAYQVDIVAGAYTRCTSDFRPMRRLVMWHIRHRILLSLMVTQGSAVSATS